MTRLLLCMQVEERFFATLMALNGQLDDVYTHSSLAYEDWSRQTWGGHPHDWQADEVNITLLFKARTDKGCSGALSKTRHIAQTPRGMSLAPNNYTTTLPGAPLQGQPPHTFLWGEQDGMWRHLFSAAWDCLCRLLDIGVAPPGRAASHQLPWTHRLVEAGPAASPSVHPPPARVPSHGQEVQALDDCQHCKHLLGPSVPEVELHPAVWVTGCSSMDFCFRYPLELPTGHAGLDLNEWLSCCMLWDTPLSCCTRRPHPVMKQDRALSSPCAADICLPGKLHNGLVAVCQRISWAQHASTYACGLTCRY